MPTTPVLIRSPETATTESLMPTSVGSIPAPKTQPLWRFALVGLGPLTALGVFALLVALFQRLA
jgi:hypothetical protein